MKLASCGSPATARSRWLVRRSKLSPKKCAIARAGSEVGTSPLPVQGRNSVVAIATKAGATIAAAQTVRSSALTPQIDEIAGRHDHGKPRHQQAQRRRRPRRGRD